MGWNYFFFSIQTRPAHSPNSFSPVQTIKINCSGYKTKQCSSTEWAIFAPLGEFNGVEPVRQMNSTRAQHHEMSCIGQCLLRPSRQFHYVKFREERTLLCHPVFPAGTWLLLHVVEQQLAQTCSTEISSNLEAKNCKLSITDSAFPGHKVSHLKTQ